MAYRYTGDYYARAQGDYYRGDPGFGSLFKGLLGVGKKLAGPALSLVPGGGLALRATRGLGQKLLRPSPALARTVAGGVVAGGGLAAMRAFGPNGAPPGQIPVPGFKGRVQRFLPFGATGFMKRRTMNHLNPRALNRAIRRLEGFRGKAVKALQAQGFTVKRRGGTGLNRRGQMACGCPKGKCVC